MPNAEETPPFGALLRHCRLAAGLTQEALAERTGLGVRSIQHLEGGAHLPHRETVDRLLRVLGLTGEERLRSARLLTLTGTGGCGKTRLALAVATRLGPDYPDGVWCLETGEAVLALRLAGAL